MLKYGFIILMVLSAYLAPMLAANPHLHTAGVVSADDDEDVCADSNDDGVCDHSDGE
jgi:hypothetical protein